MYRYSHFYDRWCEQNRSTIAIPHPLGNPALTLEEEKTIRRKLVSRALEALTTEVEDQTIFEV